MDNTKQCWYCLELTMEKTGSFNTCSNCGATWNEQPTLGEYLGVITASRSPDSGSMFRPKVMRGNVKGGLPLKPLLRPSDKDYGKKNR